ncbi:MAG: lipoprotein insertase outer membrane protein LolB [Pseudomonadota bacterium]
MRRAAAALLALLAVAGCATRPPVPDAAGFSPPPEAWSLEGRLALSNGRDGGSGTLLWEHRPELSELSFVGAFGRGSWRLRVQTGLAELTLADGQRYVAADVNDLVARTTGWSIPVGALAYWVTGQPEPGQDAGIQRGRDGKIDALRQHEWSVQFAGELALETKVLPRKITATKDGDRVRLVIRRWERLPAGA